MKLLLQSLSMGSVAVATLVGIYGRRRTDFMSDFTYNKYHFGVAVHAMAAGGLFQAMKMAPGP